MFKVISISSDHNGEKVAVPLINENGLTDFYLIWQNPLIEAFHIPSLLTVKKI